MRGGDASELEYLKKANADLTQSLQELLALRDFTKRILSSGDRDEIARVALEALARSFPDVPAEMYLADESGKTFAPAGGSEGSLKPDDSILERVMLKEEVATLPAPVERIVTVAPLSIYGQRVGILCLDMTGKEEMLTPQAMSILGEIGTQAAAALLNCNLVSKIEQQYSLLTNMLDSITNGIVTIDMTRTITRMNRNAMAMLEVTEDVVGKPLDTVIPMELRPIVHEILDETVNMGFAMERMATHRVSHGPEIPLAISTSLLRDESLSIRGLILVFRDMTASKELERLRRLDQMKSDFVANVSHELKTPLTSIKAYTEALIDMVEQLPSQMGAIPAELKEGLQQQKDFLKVVDEESDRLLYLINDLLNVARIQAGKLRLNIEKTHPHRLVTEILKLSKVQSDKHTIVTELAPDCPEVFIDREKLKEVVINLTSNAIKYSPKGGRVWIRMNVVEQNVKIEVQDEGMGIAPEHQQKVFEQFYRVDNSMTQEVSGTGLGLSIVKAIVEAHGGKVELSSEHLKGSTFTIWIPIRTQWKPQFDLEETFVD